MTIGGVRVLIHNSTIWTESYLLLLVVTIVHGHMGQALCLVELMDHILPFILEWHARGYDSYQGAIPLTVEEGAHTRYLPGDISSGVQG